MFNVSSGSGFDETNRVGRLRVDLSVPGFCNF
jgi:hypothetical protein